MLGGKIDCNQAIKSFTIEKGEQGPAPFIFI